MATGSLRYLRCCRPLRARAAAALCGLLCGVTSAQELEPRSYANLPVGMNFLVLGYAYSQGALLPDPAIGLEDPELTLDTGIVAYSRSVGLGGLAGQVGVIQPYICLDGTAQRNNEQLSREVCGPGDTYFRLGVNFYGAPALTLSEFSGYRQDWIVGAVLRIQAPTGQYDDERLVNLGSNRWRFNPELGASKALGRLIVEMAAGISFFTDNNDFFGGSTREQDPIYALQAHLIYNLPRNMWIAFDANFYRGGQSSVDGVAKDDRLESSRIGLTYALPLGRRQSLKFTAQTGLYARAGLQADTFAVSWQYRWARGY